MDQRQWTRHSLLGCAASALTVAATGCGSGSTGSSSGGSGGTLTVGVATDTSTLDPAARSPLLYCLGAYDALVEQTPRGEFKPDLATSWKFTDADHLTFEATLRKGAHFTDGTEMDAEATARLDELAWAAPVALVPTIQATRTELRKVPATFQARELDPFSPDADQNWYTSDA